MRYWKVAALLCVALALFFLLPVEKRVLVVIPSQHEKQLVQQFPYAFTFYQLPCKVDMPTAVEEICSLAKQEGVDGIVSSQDHVGAALASIASAKLGLIGPDPIPLLTCQHKYYSRLVQLASVPEATPQFSLGLNLPFPCFVKPVRSSFSRFAQVAHSAEEVRMPTKDFFDHFDQLIAYATPFEPCTERLLAEELLQGLQVTWEGFVSHSQVETIGIVDSVMFPGTLCFERFEYPSQLPENVQRRMEVIAKKFITYVGLDNTLCNIEFMYNPMQDRISIIECNPRMALQFCDLYEKVDGTNSYEIALSIATGSQPVIKKNQGKHRIAASFVLRRFQDALTLEVPTAEEHARLKSRFSDVLILIDCKVGKKLSDLFQDGKSYRYGLIHLGGQDKEELLRFYEECKEALTFTFKNID